MKEDHTTPPESISYNNLVELAVKQRHGSDAIAELTNHEDGTVERAGKRIDYFENCERWDSAKDTIIQACYAGELVAYVCNESGTVKKIDRQYSVSLKRTQKNAVMSVNFLTECETFVDF